MKIHSEEYAESLQQLLTGFGEGNLDKVRTALNGLTGSNHGDLNRRICAMTEDFHASIKTFQKELDPAQITMTSTNIPDAARKLEYVLQATSDSAMSVFNLVEKIEKNLDQTCRDLERIERKEQDIETFVAAHRNRLAQDKKTISEIIMTQEYQDLCGQALGKVIKLVKEIEDTLRTLVRHFGVNSEPAGETAGDTRFSQDEADALLKELGF